MQAYSGPDLSSCEAPIPGVWNLLQRKGDFKGPPPQKNLVWRLKQGFNTLYDYNFVFSKIKFMYVFNF